MTNDPVRIGARPSEPDAPPPTTRAARKTRSLRGVLRWLLIVPLLPLAVVSGIVVWTQWDASRAEVYRDLAREAESIALAVDQEVEIGKTMLEVLAASDLIDRQDWEGFRRLALVALSDRPDSWIALGEASGLQVLRTFEPIKPPTMNPNTFAQQSAETEWRGHRLPVSTQGLSERVLRSGRMSNTGLYFGAAIKRPAVAIGVPVVRGGQVTHVLILAFAPDRINRLILRAADAGERRAGLVDASGRVISSSREPEAATGRPISPALRELLAARTTGFREGANIVGEDVVAAFHRTAMTDWSVVVSNPRAVAFADAWRVFGAWTAVLALLLAVSAWAARALWLKLAPPLVAMGRAAHAIQQGTLPDLPASGIAEIEELGALLRDAARAESRSREAALKRAVAEEHARSTQLAAEEQALAQARFRLAIEHLPHGVVIYDEQRRYEYLNGRAIELLGRERGEMIGQRDEALWPAALAAPYVASLEAAIDGGGVQSFEWSLPSAAAADRVLAITHAPLRDDDGRLRQVLTIAYDLTERKRAEHARQANEALLRSVLDNLYTFVGVLDVDGRLLEVNREPLRRVGVARGEVIGQPFWTGPWWTHDESVARALRAAIGRAARGEQIRFDVTAREADGGTITVDLQIAPIRDQAGAITMLIASGVDITERKRTEAALRETDRQKDEFLAILSHELRNPLAPIRAAMHVIRGRSGEDPTLNHAGDIIDRQVLQLVRLIDDLLEVSRISQGRIELRRKPEAIAPIVAAAIESARPAIDAARHRLEVTSVGPAARIDADAARLSQAILNVLQNAAKYTPSGGLIRLATECTGERLRIAIEDNGIGIDADALPRIFGMFVQGERDAGRQRGGLGIGLALARRLIEMHGGSISAASDGPGRGSRFVIELPTLGESDEAPGESSQHPAALPDRGTRQRVLVVDDNVDAAETLRTLLEIAGHDARAAYGGRAALAAVAEERPDAVLLDIGMPDLDGLEVARRLRAKYGDACPRLIALSGWGQESDKRRALEAGFERHLTKPADPTMIAALLASPPAVMPG